MKRYVDVTNWAAIQRKYVYQFNGITSFGFALRIFSPHTGSDMNELHDVLNRLPSDTEFNTLSKKKITTYLKAIKTIIREPPALAILAPRGRMSPLFALLYRVLKVRLITIEWGDISLYNQLDVGSRLMLRFCYALSDLVCYKQPEMKTKLVKLRVREHRLHFLPNTFSSSTSDQNTTSLKYLLPHNGKMKFLWFNRLTPYRYPELLIEAFRDLNEEQIKYEAIFAGLFEREYEIDQWLSLNDWTRKDLESHGITFQTYEMNSQISRYQASHFMLLADQIFANNSLLESLELGMMPVVNNAPGLELIIPHNESSWKACTLELKDVKDTIIRTALMPLQEKCIFFTHVDKQRKSFNPETWNRNFASALSKLGVKCGTSESGREAI
jgi:glycosyltransferase involved in cell wall biosynthesis